MGNSLREDVELLPCPFCGYEPDIIESKTRGGRLVVEVRCTNSQCGARQFGAGCNREQARLDAPKSWNQRHPAADGVVVPRDLLAALCQLSASARAYYSTNRKANSQMLECIDRTVSQASALLATKE